MNKKDKIIKYLITIMFLLLPIIDMLRTTSVEDIEIFNISIIELINLLLIGISFIFTIPKIKKKHLKYLSIYFLIILVYTFFHIINTYNFDISLLSGASHNYIVELYYIVRVYILPLLLMIILFENKEIFNRKYYLNIIKYLVIIISGQIVLLNICRFSYSTYSDANSQYLINNTSFLDIFVTTKDFRELLTVGLFSSANQISLILFMLLPLNIYNLYLDSNKKNICLVIIQVLSMIIIGTKVAALGSILVLIFTLLMYYFFIIIKKDTFNKNYAFSHIICIIISTSIIVISPFTRLYLSGDNIHGFNSGITEEEIISKKSMITEEISTNELTKLLNENQSVFKISDIFYEMYPIENDPEFWKTMAKRDRALNNDYRIIKNDIMDRIQKRNNNKYDIILGMGYTINSMDMEKDYVYQYYLFGIFGVFILIGVYIFFYFYNILKIFNKKYFNYNFCICLVSPFIGLVACYFSGHLFGWTTPMLLLASTLCIGRVNK